MMIPVCLVTHRVLSYALQVYFLLFASEQIQQQYFRFQRQLSGIVAGPDYAFAER